MGARCTGAPAGACACILHPRLLPMTLVNYRRCTETALTAVLFPVYVTQLGCLVFLDVARRSANAGFLVLEALLRPRCSIRKARALTEEITTLGLKRVDEVEKMGRWAQYWRSKARQIPIRIQNLVDWLVMAANTEAPLEYLFRGCLAGNHQQPQKCKHPPASTNACTGGIAGGISRSWGSSGAESFQSWESDQKSTGRSFHYEALPAEENQQASPATSTAIKNPPSPLKPPLQLGGWRRSWLFPLEKTVHEEKEVAMATFWPEFLTPKERIAKARLSCRPKRTSRWDHRTTS